MSTATRPSARPDGRSGAHHDVVEASDQAYGERTFVAPSKAGAVVLPSERFMGAETITATEWGRRHTATYGDRGSAQLVAAGVLVTVVFVFAVAAFLTGALDHEIGRALR